MDRSVFVRNIFDTFLYNEVYEKSLLVKNPKGKIVLQQ